MPSQEARDRLVDDFDRWREAEDRFTRNFLAWLSASLERTASPRVRRRLATVGQPNPELIRALRSWRGLEDDDRRDDVLRRMLKTPPKPHTQANR